MSIQFKQLSFSVYLIWRLICTGLCKEPPAIAMKFSCSAELTLKYKVGNVTNKGLHGEGQNKFSKKIVCSDHRIQGLTELSRHVLDRRSLNWTLLYEPPHFLGLDHFQNQWSMILRSPNSQMSTRLENSIHWRTLWKMIRRWRYLVFCIITQLYWDISAPFMKYH